MVQKTGPLSEVAAVDADLRGFRSDIEFDDDDSASTTLILSTDHGEHGYYGHGLRLYEETTRTNLIFASPYLEPARYDSAVSLADLPATVAGLLGAQAAELGESLLSSQSRHPIFFSVDYCGTVVDNEVQVSNRVIGATYPLP